MQSEMVSQEVVTTEQTLKSSTMEVKAVKTQLQALEIELQSQLSMVSTALARGRGYLSASCCYTANS